MPAANLPRCPQCQSKNVSWRGFAAKPPLESTPPAARHTPIQQVQWACSDCGQSFVLQQDAPPHVARPFGRPPNQLAH